MLSIKKLFPFEEVARTINRFPEASVCSFVLFLFAVWLVHQGGNTEGELIVRIIAALAYGFFWFCVSRLLCEGAGLGALLQKIVSYGVYLVFLRIIFLHAGASLMWFLFLVVPALLLAISVGPYLRSNDSLSLWFYNRQTWQGAFIAALAGAIWVGGISAVFGTLHYLFGVDIPPRLYADIACFSFLVLAPLYALSWIPEKYTYSEEDCHAPAQLSFVLNWIFAPLIVVYGVILYAYFGKIILSGEVPKGMLASMILGYCTVGIATYLSGWPLRSSGGVLLRLFYKVFFPALFVPLGMLAYAAYLRIDQYGLTEQRYMIVLVIVWLSFLAVFYSFRKLLLKYIGGSLAVLLLLVSIGPFSAIQVAVYSQSTRLQEALRQNDILVDGQIVKSTKELSAEDRYKVSSSLQFLSSRKQLDKVRPWFDNGLDQYGKLSALSVAEAMGVRFELAPRSYGSKFGRKKPTHDRINLNVPHNNMRILDIQGFRYLFDNVNAHLHNVDMWEKRWDDLGIEARFKGHDLVITADGHGEVVFDLYEYALQNQNNDRKSEEGFLVFEGHSGGLKVRVFMRRLFLSRDIESEEEYQVKSFNFRLLVDY